MLFWLALAFAILVTVAAIVYAVLKGLALFRASKRLLSATSEELEAIERSTAMIESHLQAAAKSGDALNASLGRLRVSRARLNVLTAAVDDVRASVDRVTGVYPRK